AQRLAEGQRPGDPGRRRGAPGRGPRQHGREAGHQPAFPGTGTARSTKSRCEAMSTMRRIRSSQTFSAAASLWKGPCSSSVPSSRSWKLVSRKTPPQTTQISRPFRGSLICRPSMQG
ncbi:hypothetical protein HMPREF0731_0086, partial [Pseudoroseomonas cervicalis ATCC 49957]